MAINTAAKRISAANHLMNQTVLFADGTIAANDRQATARIYSGILAQTPSISLGGFSQNYFFIFYRRK